MQGIDKAIFRGFLIPLPAWGIALTAQDPLVLVFCRLAQVPAGERSAS